MEDKKSCRHWIFQSLEPDILRLITSNIFSGFHLLAFRQAGHQYGQAARKISALSDFPNEYFNERQVIDYATIMTQNLFKHNSIL